MVKEYHKTNQSGTNRFKKEYNNFNPYNKLELNKFHQIQDIRNEKHNYSHQIHKKKRDLERMIEYRKRKGLEVEQQKLDQLAKIEGELTSRKTHYQREKRKEFFIENKYKQIMNIEKRKVAKKLREIKSQQPINNELLTEWLRKLNYIKHYPKALKYVALFPTSPMSDKALDFQKKIMSDIQETLSKKKQQLNKFETEYKKQDQAPKKSKRKDDFFLEAEIEQQEDEELQQQGESEEIQIESKDV